jgi:hypothetical protein
VRLALVQQIPIRAERELYVQSVASIDERTVAHHLDPGALARICAAAEIEHCRFRLLAVVNRIDLGWEPDAVSPAGEARLVFEAGSETMVIFEYAQTGTRREWAERWHALGRASDDAIHEEVARVATSFLPTLARVRVHHRKDGVSRFLELGPDASRRPIDEAKCMTCHQTGFLALRTGPSDFVKEQMPIRKEALRAGLEEER